MHKVWFPMLGGRSLQLILHESWSPKIGVRSLQVTMHKRYPHARLSLTTCDCASVKKVVPPRLMIAIYRGSCLNGGAP